MRWAKLQPFVDAVFSSSRHVSAVLTGMFKLLMMRRVKVRAKLTSEAPSTFLRGAANENKVSLNVGMNWLAAQYKTNMQSYPRSVQEDKYEAANEQVTTPLSRPTNPLFKCFVYEGQPIRGKMDKTQTTHRPTEHLTSAPMSQKELFTAPVIKHT